MTKQSYDANYVGMEVNSLTLVTTPTLLEISVIKGSHPIRGDGLRLDGATE